MNVTKWLASANGVVMLPVVAVCPAANVTPEVLCFVSCFRCFLTEP